MKTYRRHNCSARHRTPRAFAECVWPRALWVKGSGRYASVSWCGKGVTVSLSETAVSAYTAKLGTDYAACGARCSRRHEVIELVLP